MIYNLKIIKIIVNIHKKLVYRALKIFLALKILLGYSIYEFCF